MTTVSVKPSLLTWARERSGLSADALERRFPKITLWERGEASPTLRQLEDFAKKTSTPLGYLFLQEPPDEPLPIPDFRTVRDAAIRRPSPNLLDTIYTMLRRQDWLREYLVEEEGAEPLPFIASVSLTDSPVAVAAAMRDVLGASDDWAHGHSTWTAALRALRGAAQSAGIVVVINSVVGNNTSRKLDVEEFRGFVLSDPYAPFIFVNGADAKAAQMFTLAHELAHLWLGRDGVINLEAMQPADDEVERFCNQVAAEFLVPERELVTSWNEASRSNEPFQTLARRFKVSPLVCARRALDLGLIDRSAFFDFYRAYLEDARRERQTRDGGGDFYAVQDARVGRRFAEAVIRAARGGQLAYREAFQLIDLRGATFDRYAQELGLPA